MLLDFGNRDTDRRQVAGFASERSESEPPQALIEGGPMFRQQSPDRAHAVKLGEPDHVGPGSDFHGATATSFTP